MRLYQIRDLGLWLGTQADAKAASKEHGAPWNECEVPTDKAGLMAFLTENEVGKPAGVAQPSSPVSYPEVPPVIAPASPVPGLPQAKIDHPLNLMAIEDFIGGAQPHQLGIIMREAAQRLQIIGQDLDKRQREALAAIAAEG